VVEGIEQWTRVQVIVVRVGVNQRHGLVRGAQRRDAKQRPNEKERQTD
jgi:hypothetical protein